MDTTTWVKLRPDPRLSWHVVVPTTWSPPLSRCGLWMTADAPMVDDLPFGERSCERCLRLVARDAERAEAR